MPVEIVHDHSTDAIRERLEEGSEVSYLRDWVYGGIDGAVTTFAIVSGVVGADLSIGIILVLGAANVVADGFSMAASNYTGTKAEIEEQARIRHHEHSQIDRNPEGERREVREIFRNKGFEGGDLDRAVEIITADRTLWVETMMVEEYGMAPVDRSPARAALGTFFAFLLCGMVPLLPFCIAPWLIDRETAVIASVVATAATFFAIGSAKARWSLVPWWRSALDTTAIGLGAAGVAFVIGYALRSLV
jgi:VIT1/CCC1 family predicted Fe2+/Mn2+ transporter